MTSPDAVRRITVLGFGTTGRAVCDYAVRHQLPVAVSEAGQLAPGSVGWLREHRIPYEEGGHTHRLLDDADLVVLSPGVSPALPVLQAIRRRGIPVLSEIDYALQRGPGCTVVAVTGTNGKSSTVEVIGEIIRAAGRRAWVVGNIGTPVISMIDQAAPRDILVIEISSYQLEQSDRFRPDVGVLLNLAPDHLPRHGSFEAYADSKGRLFANQTADDVAILPSELASRFDHGQGRRVLYDQTSLGLPEGMALRPHERMNLMAALAACRAVLPDLNPSKLPMERVTAAFRLPHRMQTLGTIHGVHVINDSKSTNPASAIAALRSIRSPIILLLGGRSKKAGYEALAKEIASSSVRCVVVFGEAAHELQRILSTETAVGSKLLRVETLQNAVETGLREARSGDVLLLSPACSSFDAFDDYAARGEAFSTLVRRDPQFKGTPSRT